MQFTNSWTVTATVAVIALAIGYGTARYTTPVKVVTKTVEVVKTNTVDDKDKVTTETTVKKPDGTVITQERIEDVEKIDTTETESISKQTSTTYSKPQWMISGLYGINYNSLPTPYYGASVQRRILGPIFIGVDAATNKTVGARISIEF